MNRCFRLSNYNHTMNNFGILDSTSQNFLHSYIIHI
jgi:hypothetical protein